MVKTLQKKFVRTAMIAVTVLLIVMIGAINIWYIYSTYSDAQRLAHMLSNSNGILQNTGDFQVPDGTGGDKVWSADNNFLFGRREFTLDNAMAARFFFVLFSESGAITEVGVDQISSVTEEEARAFAQEVYDGTKNSGITNGFMYVKEDHAGMPKEMLQPQDNISEEQSQLGSSAAGDMPEEQPYTIVVFMDISTQIQSIQSVLLITLFIGSASWIGMLLFVILLSKRAIRPIAENIERQKQFVTNAGHEIKTPLAIILANTDAMELIKGETKWTKNIRAQVNRLSGLMQNLLTLAKMDEADLQLQMSELSVKEITEETVQSFAQSAEDKHIEVRMNLEDIRVKGNYETVSQLIGILMDNAVKYTPDGGSITWNIRKQGKYCLIEEKNLIDPATREDDPNRLFDRFYRSDKARTQKNGGYGIGLSAAKSIAAANKGDISASYDGQKYIVFALKLML